MARRCCRAKFRTGTALQDEILTNNPIKFTQEPSILRSASITFDALNAMPSSNLDAKMNRTVDVAFERRMRLYLYLIVALGMCLRLAYFSLDIGGSHTFRQ